MSKRRKGRTPKDRGQTIVERVVAEAKRSGEIKPGEEVQLHEIDGQLIVSGFAPLAALEQGLIEELARGLELPPGARVEVQYRAPDQRVTAQDVAQRLGPMPLGEARWATELALIIFGDTLFQGRAERYRAQGLTEVHIRSIGEGLDAMAGEKRVQQEFTLSRRGLPAAPSEAPVRGFNMTGTLQALVRSRFESFGRLLSMVPGPEVAALTVDSLFMLGARLLKQEREVDPVIYEMFFQRLLQQVKKFSDALRPEGWPNSEGP